MGVDGFLPEQCDVGRLLQLEFTLSGASQRNFQRNWLATVSVRIVTLMA